MMGQHARSESLFYYFRIEDQVPENHLLRLIDRHIRFDFVGEKWKDAYSEIGRPSVDPELLLRILLIGYLYGLTSERKLVEELRRHLAWRWVTGLSFDQEIPPHSTFSKNRHGRFLESNLFQQLFEEIVERENEPAFRPSPRHNVNVGESRHCLRNSRTRSGFDAGACEDGNSCASSSFSRLQPRT
jgi:transposase